ncbi:hypothetical protein HDU96_004805 [Phlyctochytrium bullatum]|nr:hypothetical protein HDU96_004805 [Phlyctochytrium bullatum]
MSDQASLVRESGYRGVKPGPQQYIHPAIPGFVGLVTKGAVDTCAAFGSFDVLVWDFVVHAVTSTRDWFTSVGETIWSVYDRARRFIAGDISGGRSAWLLAVGTCIWYFVSIIANVFKFGFALVRGAFVRFGDLIRSIIVTWLYQTWVHGIGLFHHALNQVTGTYRSTPRKEKGKKRSCSPRLGFPQFNFDFLLRVASFGMHVVMLATLVPSSGMNVIVAVSMIIQAMLLCGVGIPKANAA